MYRSTVFIFSIYDMTGEHGILSLLTLNISIFPQVRHIKIKPRARIDVDVMYPSHSSNSAPTDSSPFTHASFF